MRAEFLLIQQAFDKLPALAAGANKAVIVNAGGTGLTVTTGTLALAGNFATVGGHALSLTTTGATALTLPTTGTVATLAGTETLSNKTLTSSTLPAAGLLAGALANGMTATTQTAGDNSTKIATTAFIAAAIAAASANNGAFFAICSGGTSFAGGGTVVPFATVVTGNAGSEFSTSTNRFTPPAGRYFLFWGSWPFNSGGTTGSVSCNLRKNGSLVGPSSSVSLVSGNASFIGAAAILDANGTDFFDVFGTNGGASAAVVSANGAFFGAMALA